LWKDIAELFGFEVVKMLLNLVKQKPQVVDKNICEQHPPVQ
jgi:hypothetical protein